LAMKERNFGESIPRRDFALPLPAASIGTVDDDVGIDDVAL